MARGAPRRVGPPRPAGAPAAIWSPPTIDRMTRVKVCGITSKADAKLAADAGAWAIGMIFTDASPRRVDVEAAVDIGAAMRRRVEVVGVFLNSPLDELVELADLCSLTALQLPGHEGPTDCGEAGRRTGCKVIKAARVRDRASVQALR